MVEVICPNCKTSFKVDNGENIVDTSKLSGTVELVPETIRNENKGENTMDLGTINFKGSILCGSSEHTYLHYPGNVSIAPNKKIIIISKTCRYLP